MSYKDYISTQTISTDIHISPKDIHSSINEAIYSILVSRVEGLCNQEGYILKDSVKIIQRNMGKIMNINNTSQIIYRIVYQADVISPQKDSNFECYIESITKMGIIGYIKTEQNGGLKESPFLIIIPREYFVDSDIVDKKVGDKIKVSVLAVRNKYKTTQIQIVAKPL